MKMKESLILTSVGFVLGLIGQAMQRPLWEVFLVAFAVGAFTCAGRMLIEILIKQIRIKRKKLL